MTSSLVLYSVQPPAVVLTLNRPDKRNALNRALIAAIRESFERARDDAAGRCVILTGAGPSFCAGMDLAELSQTLDLPNESEVVAADAQRLSDLYEFIYTLPKPTIAAVNGPAVAGGAGLVTVCDLALADPAARFGYPEARRGLVAAMVMPHLLRHVGERAARDLLLRGELIDAAEAKRIGFINEISPAGRVMDEAMSCAKAVAESGPQALANTKALLRLFDPTPSGQNFAWGSANARLTVECKEGLRAFFDKRPPPWLQRPQ